MSKMMNAFDRLKDTTAFRVTDPTKPIRILRESDDRTAVIAPITIPALLKRTAENYPDNTALMYKDEETKEWNGISYKEYRDRVEKIAKVFIKLGLERHGSVAILASNCVEYFLTELAAVHAGGIIVGVYSSNSVETCRHNLESSRSNIVVVDDAKQMEKIRAIKDKLHHLKAVVQILPPFSQLLKSSEGYWRWDEIETLNTDDIEKEYNKRVSKIAANECCSIIYTSGTVGMPKGVMLTHDNFTWDAYTVSVHFDDLQIGKEVFVSYLPLSHIAGQMADIFLPLTLAGTVYFADKDALKSSLVKTLVEAQPTFFLGVPRVYEKIQEKMSAFSSQAGAAKKMITSWAKSVTFQHHINRLAGTETKSLQYKIAKILVTDKVKQALGFSRCKYILTGAAPLCLDTRKFFLSLDMQLLEAYGLSESGGGHCSTKQETPTFETAGKSLPGTQTMIANPDENGHGEICLKGRHVFMGYLNDEEKTNEAIDDDGWLHTGDVGYVDKEGYIYITGRIKELVITAGGENIPAVLIENNVKRECLVLSNVFLVGDKRKFLTLLVTLKTEMDQEGAPKDELAPETLKWIESLNLNYTKLSEVLAAGPDQKVFQAIQDAIIRVNKNSISNAQKVQKFAILPSDFSMATGELTPTLKLKRSVVIKKYSEIIENLYN